MSNNYGYLISNLQRSNELGWQAEKEREAEIEELKDEIENLKTEIHHLQGENHRLNLENEDLRNNAGWVH